MTPTHVFAKNAGKNLNNKKLKSKKSPYKIINGKNKKIAAKRQLKNKKTEKYYGIF